MSPKTKILLVAGSLITVNVMLAVLLFITPQHPDPARVKSAYISETTSSAKESIKVPDTPSVNAPIESVVASSATRTEHPTPDSTHVIIPVLATSTVLDAMQAYKKVSDTFSFSGKEYPGLGLFVEEINGVRPADGRYWMLYVHGTQAAEGVSAVEVTPGDTVEWRYEASMEY